MEWKSEWCVFILKAMCVLKATNSLYGAAGMFSLKIKIWLKNKWNLIFKDFQQQFSKLISHVDESEWKSKLMEIIVILKFYHSTQIELN
jgi:hypothetical protein